MTVKELREYLNAFDETLNFAIVVVDPQKRLMYKNDNALALRDMPCIIIETIESESMDSVKKRVTGENQ